MWCHVQVEPGSEVPSGRGGAAAVAIGQGRVLVVGGADRAPQGFDDFWLLEFGQAGGHWTKISPVVKLAKKLLSRSGASLTYLPGEDGGPGSVLLFGGQDPVAGVIFDDLLSLDTSTWELTDIDLEREQQERPPARHSHVAGAYQGRGLILFGGAGLRVPLNDVWRFDKFSGEWQCLSADLSPQESPEAREMAAGAMISDAGLLVHGGRAADGGLLDDLCIFDGRAGRWVLIQPTGFPRCAHTASNAASSAPSAAAQPASSAGGGDSMGGGSTGSVGDRGVSVPPASNVLLYGGFTGETVSSDLLQLTFLRQQRSSGGPSLRAELRPVKAGEQAPQPRFAHGAAVLEAPEAAQLVILGGVNQTDDLSDVWKWVV